MPPVFFFGAVCSGSSSFGGVLLPVMSTTSDVAAGASVDASADPLADVAAGASADASADPPADVAAAASADAFASTIA